MTEVLIGLALAIAGATLVTVHNAGAFVKAIVWGFTFLALMLHIAGRAITAPDKLRMAIREVVRDWWPVMALATMILGGSIYARLAEDIKETFLGFGLGMLFLPMVAVAVRASARPLHFAKILAFVYVGCVLGLLVLLALGRSVFHEEIFIAVPLGAYLLSQKPLRWWAALLGFALVAVCLISVKNTTFLLVMTVLLACMLVWVIRAAASGDRLRVVTGIYFAALALAGLAVALVLAYLKYKSQLPTGSPEYRIEMYGIAWRRFLESPIWGTGFTDSAVTYFELFRVAVSTQTLPTHSDVFDMLAHGGAIAIGLWAMTVWRILAIGWDAMKTVAASDRAGQRGGSPVDMRPWRWLFMASLVEVCAIVTYAFNPLLHRPSHGVLIWGIAGVMWALHRHLTDTRPVAVAVPAWQRTAVA